ncbi:PREDICTED: zinc finger protein 628-like [Papilio xuthus]|uniref:Zinc finger protein 628-like n=1 Tax=Papilio xuthus TaxID=66420 RepID=A0AAJ6ZB01_PAPXU|nr:PREDICTED: zinc finger protein 628-like [Papilio xuthus]
MIELYRCGGDAMSAAPAVKRELEAEGAPASPGRKRRKQAAPARAQPPAPPALPLDLHAKVADIYKSALAFGDLPLPPFDPLAAFRLLPRHDPPRIFNPEAYCDLCCKEFCNKYFLKTHRANKHGIYDGDAQPVPQPSPPRRASDEESGGTPRRLSPDSARRARGSGFQPDVLRRLGVINPEAFCEICCKEYCNKYFLRTHRERRHGVPVQRSPAATPPMQPLPSAPLTPALHSPPALPQPPHISPSPYDADMPAEVKRECEDDLEQALRDGQTSPLNLIVEERGAASPGSASEELRKLQTMISQLNELAAERLSEEPAEGARPQSTSPPAQDERRSAGSAAAGSSFCEICNKELCNKYFMRTHMQRMHGISLESGTQLGGVTCDICHKELCSKYFLRVHKHNTHGIPAPPAPANAAPAEPCPLCARRFRGPRALRAHLLAEHAPPARPAPPPPRPLDLLVRDKPYACSYCPFTTDVLAFLFAHERAHMQRPAEGGGGPEGGEEAEGEAEAEEGGEVEAEAYSCSRCEFRAEGFAALEAHVRAAHGGAGALLAVPRAPRAPLTMQPFVLEEAGGALSLLPALVFLPVRRRATRRATVTLTLTPA